MRITSRAALYLFFQIIAKSSIASLFILLARNIDQGVFGEFVFGLNSARYLTLVFMMGSSAVLVKHWGDLTSSEFGKKENNFHFLNWYILRSLTYSILIFLLFFLFLQIFNLVWLSSVEIFMSVFFVVFIPISLMQNYYISIKKPHYAGFIAMMFNLFWLLITVFWLFVFFNASIKYIVSSLFILGLFTCFVWYEISRPFTILVRKAHHHNWKFAASHFWSVSFGLADIFLIKVFLDLTDVAVFGVLLQIIGIIAFFLGAISSSIVPYLAEFQTSLSREDFQKKLTLFARIAAIPGVLIIMIFLILGEHVLGLYGQHYVASFDILIIMLLGSSVNILCGFNGWLLNLIGHEGYVARVFFIALIIKLFMGAALCVSFGLAGVAVSFSISLVVWNVMLVRYSLRQTGYNTSIF